jgi:D-glycero-alpha-D-manno-heptose 1-phosphate guanylyltransferase
MKAVVLCGGLGTRLGELTRETPKPLLNVAGKPFVAHVLEELQNGGVSHACLAVSFQWQKLKAALGDRWNGLPLSYSVEEEPLGTGGAIRKALTSFNWPEALIANGDTLVEANLQHMHDLACRLNADVVLALKHVADTARYGRINLLPNSKVASFSEKGLTGPGLINAGLFWIRADILATIPQTVFSFEQDFMMARLQEFSIYGLPTDGYFIDMGIPEDLAKACRDLEEKP